LSSNVEPARLTGSSIAFALILQPQQSTMVDLTIECVRAAQPRSDARFDEALATLAAHDRMYREQYTVIETSDRRFNEWINRSAADLRMMTTETLEGPYPYAGVPWFNTVFGRDGIITALSVLWVNPTIAEGVLRHLAATQATTSAPEQDAEPGKIMHEARG